MTDIIHLRPNTEVNLFTAPTHLYRPARLNNNSGTPFDRHANRELGGRETAQRRAPPHSGDGDTASAAARRRVLMKSDSQFCRISRLCQGLLPLAGALVAFATLIGVAIFTA